MGPNLGVFPLEQTRYAKSEHPRLTNVEINFNVTDGQTDGQTDDDRNTALCTKVHRAVKTTRFGQLSNRRATYNLCNFLFDPSLMFPSLRLMFVGPLIPESSSIRVLDLHSRDGKLTKSQTLA